MRCLAIIFVVMVHGSMLEKADTNFPWIRFIDGVELFFVLSGFLIGGILIRLFEEPKVFGWKELLNFWLRRWFRTLPNYYLVLILNIIIVYFGVIKEDFSQFNWKFFFFLQNFYEPFTDFFWESWSLSVEEWFYLLFPPLLVLVFIVLDRFKVRKQIIVFCAILIFLIVPFLLRLFVASSFEVDEFWLRVKIYKVVVFRLDSLALGLLAAFIKFYFPVFWHKSRNYAFLIGLAISYYILYTIWLPNEFITKVFIIFFKSFGCVLLLPKFDSIKTAPIVVTRVVTHISLISYSMYLINLALVAEIIYFDFPPTGPQSAWAMYFVYWFIVITVSTLMYKYYEKPIMKLRDRIKIQ